MMASEYPKPGHEASLSGRPEQFSHVESIGPRYNDAASGGREKRAVRNRTPQMQQAFRKAHEGPREKVAEPHLQAAYRPAPQVVAEVHAQHDRLKRLRNRQKDQQMQAWREAKITTSHRFNAQAMKPVHLREKKTPEVFSAATKREALKQRLQQKKERVRDGHSR